MTTPNELKPAGGATDMTVTPPVTVVPPKETVAREDHERALSDMHKFKKEAETLRLEKEASATAKLKEQNDWKALAEAKEKEAKEANDRANNLQKSFLGEKKFGAVRAAAEKLGLRPEAVADLENLDLAEITIETTSTGRINIHGTEKFTERLKTIRPHWFTDKVAPNVNTNGTRVIETTGDVTAAMIVEAEKKGRKSGDMSEYKSLHQKYQQQRQAKMPQR